jgi:hypothetical protein
MIWYFAFAIAGVIGLIFICFNSYVGFFILGGAFGALLYKLLDDGAGL